MQEKLIKFPKFWPQTMLENNFDFIVFTGAQRVYLGPIRYTSTPFVDGNSVFIGNKIVLRSLRLCCKFHPQMFVLTYFRLVDRKLYKTTLQLRFIRTKCCCCGCGLTELVVRKGASKVQAKVSGAITKQAEKHCRTHTVRFVEWGGQEQCRRHERLCPSGVDQKCESLRQSASMVYIGEEWAHISSCGSPRYQLSLCM